MAFQSFMILFYPFNLFLGPLSFKHVFTKFQPFFHKRQFFCHSSFALLAVLLNNLRVSWLSVAKHPLLQYPLQNWLIAGVGKNLFWFFFPVIFFLSPSPQCPNHLEPKAVSLFLIASETNHALWIFKYLWGESKGRPSSSLRMLL